MQSFIDNIRSVIERHNMISPGDSIVVGVSGGPDSICLLHALLQLAGEYELKLYAVHLNHCFRGEEADADAEYVRQICEQWNIRSFIEKVDVPAYAEVEGLSSEEAGREVRYRLFEETARQVGANKIAVAQNQNDQVETVLMRFLRGSGLEGLKGIEPVRGNIIRPLIETERQAIEEYCHVNSLEPRIDKTNLEPIYVRNKVRLELLPYLQRDFNPNLSAAILRMSNIIRDENEYLELQTEALYSDLASLDKGNVVFDSDRLKSLHPAMQMRLVRLGVEKMLGTLTGFEYKNFESVVELLGKATGAAVILPRGIKAYVSYRNLILSKNVEKQKKKCYYKLIYDGVNSIPESDISISTEVLEADCFDTMEKGKYSILIDMDKIKDGLMYRNRLEGDTFSPIGMKGSKKLKDYFIDEKIPREERDEVELLADGSEIVWVIGKRISEKYKVAKDTKNIIAIKYKRGHYDGE